jgi:hypothetical protein
MRLGRIVSKLKSPQEKKTASLDHDRRNTYGENDKSSRKNIPKSKQLSHQAERKAANQPLGKLRTAVSEDDEAAVELESRVRAIEKRRNGFRKRPDASLRELITYQKTGEWPAG